MNAGPMDIPGPPENAGASAADADWHEHFWNKDWLRLALHLTGGSPEREARFIERVLGLRPGLHVLDMPCGHGRHAVELAGHGLRVTGVDICAESIEIATAEARRRELAGASFTMGDMRTYRAAEPADAAIMMQTSFGFMATQAEDEQILANVRRSLAPGGRLMIDTVSLFRLARTMLVPRRWERLDDDTVHIEDREYDFRTGRRITRTELFTRSGEHVEMTSSIRLYTLPEMSAMLTGAGYEVTAAYGGYDGQPFDFEAKRLIVVARTR